MSCSKKAMTPSMMVKSIKRSTCIRKLLRSGRTSKRPGTIWALPSAVRSNSTKRFQHTKKRLKSTVSTRRRFIIWRRLEDKGSDDKAIEYYEKVVEAEPERGVDARINAGILYARKGDLAKAVASYKAAIAIDANVADAHFNLGIAYAKLAAKADDEAEKKKLWGEEAKAYREATAKNPSYHKAWYNLAIAFKKLGNVDEEISAYLKAIGVKKDYPQALFNLAHAYEEKKDVAKALEYWGRYITVAEAVPTEKKYVETAKQRVDLLKKQAPGADKKPEAFPPGPAQSNSPSPHLRGTSRPFRKHPFCYFCRITRLSQTLYAPNRSLTK